MRHIAQFQPGSWWLSDETGREWVKISGPAAQQFVQAFDLIRGAIELLPQLKETDGFNFSAQFIREGRDGNQAANSGADPSAGIQPPTNISRITGEEIRILAAYLADHEVFPRKDK